MIEIMFILFLKMGAEKTREKAQETMKRVRERVGLNY
jgi:hypothetical protein